MKHHPAIIHEPEEVLVFNINTDAETRYVCSKEFFYSSSYNKGLSYLDKDNLVKNDDNYEVKMEVAKVEYIVEPINTERTDVDEYIKQYYIIEPRLERIVSVKYKDKIKGLESKLNAEEHFNNDLINVISNYNNLPWWKKLFTFHI